MRRRAKQPGKGVRRVADSSPTSTQARLGLRPAGRRPWSVRVRNGKKPVRRRWDWTQLPLMLTALAAVGALYFNTNQTSQALQATRDQVGLSEQGQLTDRFSKAVEQLGTQDSLEVRLGGIYALERIARDSARDHPTVMEVLSAYVREHAPLPLCTSTAASARPTTDVQAILTVIGRRDINRDRDPLALNDTCLGGANLTDAGLRSADLSYADLSGADLSGADLGRAYLGRAYLTGAYLTGANLGGANLIVADLSDAHLPLADLCSADLTGTDLGSANLGSANLGGAYLDRANLTNADLTNADLTNANLFGTNLTDVRGLP